MSEKKFNLSVESSRNIPRFNTDEEGNKLDVRRVLNITNVKAEFPITVIDDKLSADSIADFKSVSKMTGDIVKVTLTSADVDSDAEDYVNEVFEVEEEDKITLTSFKNNLKSAGLIVGSVSTRRTKADIEEELEAEREQAREREDELAIVNERQALINAAFTSQQSGELSQGEFMTRLEDINGMTDDELLVSCGRLTV